jgi:hypothetical protein
VRFDLYNVAAFPGATATSPTGPLGVAAFWSVAGYRRAAQFESSALDRVPIRDKVGNRCTEGLCIGPNREPDQSIRYASPRRLHRTRDKPRLQDKRLLVLATAFAPLPAFARRFM